MTKHTKKTDDRHVTHEEASEASRTMLHSKDPDERSDASEVMRERRDEKNEEE